MEETREGEGKLDEKKKKEKTGKEKTREKRKEKREKKKRKEISSVHLCLVTHHPMILKLQRTAS